MRTFDIQAIAIAATPDAVFEYVADRRKLPEWTNAFERVGHVDAVMRTPAGSTTVDLHVHTSREARTIDWEMRFPDGDVGWAWARVVPHREGSVFTFVLPAPPVPLEQLEGTLEEQSKALAQELKRLADLLNQNALAAR